MITPRGIPVKVLNKLVEELNQRGLYAERHSYSIRMMYQGRFVASLHLYPGFNQAVLRVYGESERINKTVEEVVEELVKKYLGDLELNVQAKPLSF
ncbi:hypothetical protein IMZ38_03735 [Thermosphaera chiliense]|uniref:Uncharacterized protein n=1 Tax=Thermosphaera chiliense TaxID=3402707 RepID=A0A7M1UTI0_9CREN|nr:hypothetical protein [Thermosphaera aggregans]QOR95017.1 hypothetical protein IMZ38_03735 [Thermosphaera aggregans]